MIKFLVVDDSVFSEKVTATYLKKYFNNTDIQFAGDGKEGLQKYEDFQPDYIFADLLMPVMSGFEFIQALNERGFRNIIVLSVNVQNPIRRQAEAMGILAFYNKPLNDSALQELRTIIKDR